MKLQLMNGNDLKAEVEDDKFVRFTYPSQYALGNYYRLVLDKYPAYVWVQLDGSIRPSLVYINQPIWDYKIPFNIEREWPYPDGAFLGKNHYSWVRVATEEEIKISQNLALNTYDQHELSGAYPHASANAETRNEMAFFAKNAIDGISANSKHGSYPFQSWGIDQRDDAEFKLDFGRNVNIEKIEILLRADYPHDISWQKMTIQFSDGSLKTVPLVRTADYQVIKIDKENVKWLKLTKLLKDQVGNFFPALTQIKVIGTNQ